MGEDISIQSYSASFAKRMGLSKSKYGEPKEPIKGYEYRITRALDGKYECQLNVYFDNAMDFKYPEGDVGAKYLIFHKLLALQEMDNPDRRFKRINKTQQPPAKAGGLVLWTESPDTGQIDPFNPQF